MVRLGADADGVDQVAAELERFTASIERSRSSVDAQLARTTWNGSDADAFRTAWRRSSQADLEALRQDLAAAASELRRQASEQRATSSDGRTTSGVLTVTTGGGVIGSTGAAGLLQPAHGGLQPAADPRAVAGTGAGLGGTPDGAAARAGSGSSGPPHVVAVTSTQVGGVGTSVVHRTVRDNYVHLEELSDGTFRVVVDVDTERLGGPNAHLLIGSVGLTGGVQQGLTLEYTATDEAAARRFQNQLADRLSEDPRGIDWIFSDELLVDQGVRLTAMTEQHANLHGEASASMIALGAGASRTPRINETTTDLAAGQIIDRSVYEWDVSGSVADQGGYREWTTVEIVRDRSTGEPITARVTDMIESNVDQRSGVQRRRDVLMHAVTSGHHESMEQTLQQTSTRFEFDVGQLEDGALREAILRDDRDAVRELAPREAQHGRVEELAYQGSYDAQRRGFGLLGFGRDVLRGERNLELTSHRTVEVPPPSADTSRDASGGSGR